MANRHRRNLDPSFKTKIALEALKGQKTVSQICAEFSVHPNQVSKWKQQALSGMPTLFGQQKSDLPQAELERITAPLFQQIGQLKVELDFVKKKLQQTP